jgi:hypothetical protein
MMDEFGNMVDKFLTFYFLCAFLQDMLSISICFRSSMIEFVDTFSFGFMILSLWEGRTPEWIGDSIGIIRT